MPRIEAAQAPAQPGLPPRRERLPPRREEALQGTAEEGQDLSALQMLRVAALLAEEHPEREAGHRLAELHGELRHQPIEAASPPHARKVGRTSAGCQAPR